MNLRGFEQDFTKDLESFVKRPAGWEPIPLLKTWSAKKTAAPERHKMLGFESGLSPQTQIHLLDSQNTAFEIIESLLRIYLNPIEYNGTNSFAQIDTEAEQVWLFAMRWLEHYYECLMEPLAIRTEFYKHSHTKFLELMRKMLAYNPKRRITFYDALKIWYPSCSVFSEHLSNETDSPTTIDPYPLGDQRSLTEGGTKVESSAECHSPAPFGQSLSAPQNAESSVLLPEGGTQVESLAECHSHVHVAASPNPLPSYCTVSAEPPNVALPALSSGAETAVSSSLMQKQQQQQKPHSRLVLKQFGGLVGHNKTRRSPRNSGRSPAIGNRGTRARG